MAALLAVAAADFALITPFDHGTRFVIGMLATGAAAGGSVYVAHASQKNRSIRTRDVLFIKSLIAPIGLSGQAQDMWLPARLAG